MGQVSSRLRNTATGYVHWCPGCSTMHQLPHGGWTFDGDLETPTFSPSFRHQLMVKETTGIRKPAVCHYHLIAGKLIFAPDSTHALAGQTVPLPVIPPAFSSYKYDA